MIRIADHSLIEIANLHMDLAIGGGERPFAVLDFDKAHVFEPADFLIRNDGVCRLDPEMPRTVVTRLWT